MLTFFMVNQLMMAEKTANLQYGATQAFVYAFTFIGGLFADKILGFRKSLFWGGSLMVVGSEARLIELGVGLPSRVLPPSPGPPQLNLAV